MRGALTTGVSPQCSIRILSRPVARLAPVAPRPSLHLGSVTSLAPGAARLRPQPRLPPRPARRPASTTPRAMVNVDVSPSVILGVSLIGAGVSLWQIRQSKPWISKDYDVVVSCISLLVGGILIFQGWRLDPLLLFGQLMTAGAAASFGIEALRLRSEVYEQEEKAALADVLRRKGGRGGPGGGSGEGFQLPPPPPPTYQGDEGWAAQRWAQGGGAEPGYYDNQYEDQAVGAAGYGAGPARGYGGGGGADGGGDYIQEADYYDAAAADEGGYYDNGYYYEGPDARGPGGPAEFEFPPGEDGYGAPPGREPGRRPPPPAPQYPGTSEDWE